MEQLLSAAADRHSRRDFIANIALGIGTTLGVGSLVYRFLEYLYPVVSAPKLVEVPVGKTSDIPTGGVKLVQLPEGPVLLEKAGNEVRAFSAICTHLGCTVQWRPEESKFVCPCHQGIYDLNGKVISGPPPRPLEKVDVKVSDEQIFVLMKSVKQEGV